MLDMSVLEVRLPYGSVVFAEALLPAFPGNLVGSTVVLRDKKAFLVSMHKTSPCLLFALLGCVDVYIVDTDVILVLFAQESAKDPVAFVQGLLALRDKYDRIVNEAFRGEKRSQKRLKEVG